jgi:hypothetical protein
MVVEKGGQHAIQPVGGPKIAVSEAMIPDLVEAEEISSQPGESMKEFHHKETAFPIRIRFLEQLVNRDMRAGQLPEHLPSEFPTSRLKRGFNPGKCAGLKADVHVARQGFRVSFEIAAKEIAHLAGFQKVDGAGKQLAGVRLLHCH